MGHCRHGDAMFLERRRQIRPRLRGGLRICDTIRASRAPQLRCFVVVPTALSRAPPGALPRHRSPPHVPVHGTAMQRQTRAAGEPATVACGNGRELRG